MLHSIAHSHFCRVCGWVDLWLIPLDKIDYPPGRREKEGGEEGGEKGGEKGGEGVRGRRGVVGKEEGRKKVKRRARKQGNGKREIRVV